MARYDNQRNTSPVVSSLSNADLNIKRSQDDFSRPITFDASFGWIIPFDCIRTLPSSDYDISYDILCITRNPAVRRLFNRCKIIVHTYYQPEHNIFEGAPTMLTRGFTGKDSSAPARLPWTSTHCVMEGAAANWDIYSTQFSPSHYLGLPNRVRTGAPVSRDTMLRPAYTTLNSESDIDVLDGTPVSYVHPPVKQFNALPLALYQQICFLNYLPRNLLGRQQYFYPSNERHFCFAYDCPTDKPVLTLSYDNTKLYRPAWIYLPLNEPYAPGLDYLRVRQFQGDPFNTGLPFPDLIRGDIPRLDIAASQASVEIPAGQLLVDDTLGVGISYGDSPETYYSGHLQAIPFAGSSDPQIFLDPTPLRTGTSPLYVLGNGSQYGQPRSLYLKSPLTGTAGVSIQSSVTLSQLRTLDILTTFRARNARTDGTYEQFIGAQYQVDPHYDTGAPRYIGGFQQDIVFSEITQTSSSTDSQPLGTTASKGVGAGNGNIGRVHSDDFGYIMSVLCIVPEMYYVDGVDREWTQITPDDYYFPVMESMPPVPILNKELYLSGDDSVDNDVFAYQEPMYWRRWRKPLATGSLSADADESESDSAYIMKRNFKATPRLSYGFTGMFPSNMDFSVFSNTIDTPFIISARSNISKIEPIPYAFNSDTRTSL